MLSTIHYGRRGGTEVVRIGRARVASNKAGVLARSRRHLRGAGLGYWAQARAGGVGVRMIGGGAAALVHAVVPGLFTWTASRTARTLDIKLSATRRRSGADPTER